jgi:dolichyl-phosphate-mannose-protein mannosyltransferase
LRSLKHEWLVPGTVKKFVILLLALGVVQHVFRLDEPREVVFDEVHFGKFVNAYCCSGSYFFDIHPPHAKLLVAGVAWLGGYRGEQEFASIGEPIVRVSPALLRSVPALAGALLPALIFVLLIQLGASPPAAFLAGFAILLDNALLVQTRLLALDGILLAATFGALSAVLAALSSPDGSRRRLFSLLAGALCGLAAGTKFTGLLALALVGICFALRFLRAPGRERFRVLLSSTVWVLIGAAVVYLAGWMIHFQLLTEDGPGNVWGPLTGEPLRDTVRVHRQMLSANFGLHKPHSYASPWWSWPAMERPIFYWKEGGNVVYFLGNPFVWWMTSFGMIVFAGVALLSRASNLELGPSEQENTEKNRTLWLPSLGFVLSLAPLTQVPRVLFLYHYLTPMIFGICVVVLGLDSIGWTRAGSLGVQRRSYYCAILFILLGFLAISPFSFAFVNAPEYQQRVFSVFPSWR